MFQSLLTLYNPWWKNSNWQMEGVRRDLFDPLFVSIEKPDYVTVLMGARQSGNTFLIKQCISTLLKGRCPAGNICYFLMDDPELALYVEQNPTEFANFLRNEMVVRGRIFVFIDEFQKAARITDLVKLFYESGSEIKFVLTCSSSMLVADKISESLLGRTETFILYPFSFREFLSISATDWPFSLSLSACSEVSQSFLTAPEDSFADVREHYSQNHYAYQFIASQQLPRYLLTGGYPQAAMAATSEEAFLRLKEIKQTFVEKDIVSLLRIERLAEFDRCMRMLALQSGTLLQYNDLQMGVGAHFQTIKQFLNILEATYLWSLEIPAIPAAWTGESGFWAQPGW